MSGVQPVFNLNEKTGAGFGGSEWLWVVVLFVLLGGGGNLFGNKGNTATQADIQRGFDYSNEMSQMRGLTYGQANSTYALRISRHLRCAAAKRTETLMQFVQKGIGTLAVL